ncbi:MAG: 50S ribosomal protein L15 [Gemmatimonadetes bacterium]|nr:50S ribosomal protein L15 [Gemmatimonadota bacterium]|tara:strand:+ start:1682 stop:2215 length:534 start_codon:yes stop_codon:yes gene_type:complete
MKLGNIKAPEGVLKKKKRLGTGAGSGTGKTSGKGHKGQNSRSGGGVKPWFEGGQMPIQMRLPKVGFNSSRPKNQVLNVADLERKSLEGAITVDALKEAGLIGSASRPVKILGDGDLSRAVHIAPGIKVSATALEKITKAGGSVADADTTDSSEEVAEPEGATSGTEEVAEEDGEETA